MKNILLKSVILSVILLMGVSNAWADSGDFYNTYLTYTFGSTNGSAEDSDNGTGLSQDLGTLSSGSFKITAVYLKCWDDWGSNYKSSGGQMCYSKDGGSTQYQQGFSRSNKSSGSNNYEWKNTNANLTIANSTDKSGSYQLNCWFQTWGDNWGDRYFPKNIGNYVFKYKIAPPAVKSFTVTPSGDVISGSGAQADPYIIRYNGSLTLTLSGSQNHTDANSTIQYNASGTWNTIATSSISGVTSTSVSNVTVKARYTNNDDANLSGAESSKTIYYRSEYVYTVAFNANGHGTAPAEQEISEGGKATIPTAPTATGYTFVGWYKESACTNKFDFSTTITADITLYAHWTANTYYVHFDGNGSTSGSMVDQQFTYDKEQTLSKNIFSKEGCIFTGWNTAADGSGTSYTDQQSVSNLATEGTITLYAQWSTANCKWLETDIANIESGDVVIITMSKGIKTWTLQNAKNTESAPEAIEIQENIKGDHLNINHDYYSWIVNKNETILTFESTRQPLHYLYSNSSDDGVRVGNKNNAETNQSFKILGKYLLNIQTSRFFGVSLSTDPPSWRSYKTCSGVIEDQTLKFYKKVCLDENNYWVTWDAGEGQFKDGKSTKIEYYQVGAEITPPTPTRTGYNFTWNPIPENTMPEDNMTYTAQWTLKTTTITLSPQGGTDGTESVKATYSQNMPEITPPKRTGYNFQGYFSSNGGTGTKYYNADGTSATTWDHEAETFTLIAYWTAKITTVSFDPNGGDGGQTSAVTATYDQAMPAVAIPTRVGHTFLGYFDAASEGTKYYNADGSSAKNWDKEVAEITLYAQWQVNKYTVTWNANEGNWHGQTENKEVTYDYGATIAEPEDPVRAGWVFKGWTTDRSNVVEPAKTMPANNLEYFALWGEAYCENRYTFHTGNIDVWNNPTTQNCFVRKAETTEWQIVDYVIPTGDDHTHFLVAYSGWPQRDQGSLGGHSKSVTSTWSETMYLAPAMNFESAANTPKVGHAAGAKGTLRIFDDSSWDNLCVGFIPNGYGITITGETVNASHVFHKTTTVNKWETDVIKLPGVTNHKYAMGLATEEEGTYVTCDHSKAAENIQKMGVTDKVVYLVVNDKWKADNARFAVCFMNSDKSVQTWVDMNKIQLQYAKDLYVATVPADQKYVIFCRMNGTSVENNWDNRWTQTSDIELPTNGLAIVCTISNWTEFTTTGATPQTQQNGKFRMWDNSDNKNWYVHFVPYYLLSYDKNGGEGEMAPTEYNTEDANNKVIVAANEFTRTGYDFVAWNTKADGTGTTYNPSDLFTMTADATIYAIWKAQDYQITYKDQGNEDYSGSNEAKLPKTHTYDKATELVNGEKIGYTFEGWYDNPDCTGDAITKLDAKGYTADITLYAKWTFAMEYTITNTETIFITSAVEQNIKATQPLILKVSNMPVGTTIDLSAGEYIHFYYANEEIKKLTNKYVDETFELEIVYKPEVPNTKEQPSITLNVLEHEKVIADLISCRSLPTTFAIVAKVGSMWYALPSQGLNSTDDLIGYPVEVDNIADPTAVTAVPENADWSLRQVYAASHSDALKDRFKQYGANIMFENNASPAKMLNASVSDNYLLTNAEYDSYKQSDNQGLYEWTPTTTDLETYQLTNEQRSRTLSVNTATVFGVHATDKAVEQVRFLPIQNRYTPAALQVVEWKENSVVIMYNGDPTQTAQTSINGTNVASVTLANVQKDIAVYELPADGLGIKPNQTLSVSIGSEKLLLPTPYMVNSEVTDEVLLGSSLNVQARRDIAKVSNLVILKGGKLTSIGAKTNPYTFRNVTIYGGGTLVVSADKGFGANTLTMRVGGVEDGNYKNLYPQLQLKGTLTNTSGQINLDYLTTNEFYYPLSVPYPVTIADIQYPVEIYGANVKSNNTGSFQFKYYDGAERAAGRTGWIVLDESQNSTLNPNTGYAIWGIPKKINGTRQKFGIHRLPLKQTAADMMISEKASHEATVKVYNGSKRESDNGWNYLGNPFLSHYGDFTTDADVMKLGKLVWDEEQGAWVVTDEYQRYVVFTNDCQNYTAELANATVIPAFSAFFIQADQGGVINFASPNVAAVQSLAARRTEEENKEITTGIILSGEKHSDRTGLLIADQFTEAYEFNADLSKFDNQDMNLYTISPNGKLAFMAINEELAKQTIPLGYSVSADGMYTIAFDEQRYSRDDIYALYLIDYDRNETTNLLHMDYDFYSETGANVERFALQVAFAPSTTTDVEYTQVGDILVSREGNTLRLDNLPSDATVTIYDAVGHLIEQRIASQLLQLTLQKGYYLIHIGSNQNSVVIDTFIP